LNADTLPNVKANTYCARAAARKYGKCLRQLTTPKAKSFFAQNHARLYGEINSIPDHCIIIGKAANTFTIK
jgi:hypothetical protein